MSKIALPLEQFGPGMATSRARLSGILAETTPEVETPMGLGTMFGIWPSTTSLHKRDSAASMTKIDVTSHPRIAVQHKLDQ